MSTMVGEFENRDLVGHDVELVCPGLPALTHFDALTGHPVIRSRPKARQFEEDQSVVAVSDDTVPPAATTSRRSYPHDRSGTTTAKNGQTIQKSRDETCEQHNQDDQNDHSDVHLAGPVAAFS